MTPTEWMALDLISLSDTLDKSTSHLLLDARICVCAHGVMGACVIVQIRFVQFRRPINFSTKNDNDETEHEAGKSDCECFQSIDDDDETRKKLY